MKSAKQEMEKKIRKAEAEYRERYGKDYCLFKTQYGALQIAQRQLWYLASQRFDSIVFCDIVMPLETKSFYDACVKAYEAGYRGVINSDVERMRDREAE